MRLIETSIIILNHKEMLNLSTVRDLLENIINEMPDSLSLFDYIEQGELITAFNVIDKLLNNCRCED